MALHHASCAKQMTTVRYYLPKKSADPIIRSNNNGYSSTPCGDISGYRYLRIEELLLNHDKWRSIAWKTAGETRWIAQRTTNMDKERELLID